jgi:outer membrane protein assembly factor BamB
LLIVPDNRWRTVIAWFGSAGLYCYDFNGKELWNRDLGRQKQVWGWGSSPILHGESCILNFGPGVPSFLLSVNKKSGKTIWQVDEPNADTGEKRPGHDKPEWVGSWSTPVIIEAGRRES